MTSNASIQSYLGLPFSSSNAVSRREQERSVVDAPYPEPSTG